MLSQRKNAILKTIVNQYIANATPVASDIIACEYRDKVSSATIRNEMAWLENENYIIRPHISSGGIPSDRGYRYYVEELMGEPELPLNEQRTIRHMFYQVEQQIEEWARLAAAILAGEVTNIALVTLPRANESRLKHLELMAVRESLILLIVLLHDTRIRQQLLAVETPLSQEELSSISEKLNNRYTGLNRTQIHAADDGTLSPVELRISHALLQMIDVEDNQPGEPCLDGLRHFLKQPDFTNTEDLRSLIELLEKHCLLNSILSILGEQGGVQVIIGTENTDSALKKCSLVLSAYNSGKGTSGIVGVIGPTRMRYHRVISAVQYLSSIMNELTVEISD
ncbi:MAG: heat-inducible transcription repressor HrcA [Dehalococcoidia bacterium]|nr:heat-inducible transcription repressor HrcA [Dehalococcoidia bacterium]